MAYLNLANAPGTVGIVSATIKGVAGTFRIPFAGGGARSGGRGPTVGDLGPAEQHDAAPLTRRLVSRIPLHIGFAGEDDRLCRRTARVDLVAAIDRQISIAGGCEDDDTRIDVQRGDRIGADRKSTRLNSSH